MTGDGEKQVLLKAYNAPLKLKSLFFPLSTMKQFLMKIQKMPEFRS